MQHAHDVTTATYTNATTSVIPPIQFHPIPPNRSNPTISSLHEPGHTCHAVLCLGTSEFMGTPEVHYNLLVLDYNLENSKNKADQYQ